MARNLNLSLTSPFQAGAFETDSSGPAGMLPRLTRFLEGGRPEPGRGAADAAARYGTALEALDREIDRIRLQSRHWLM